MKIFLGMTFCKKNYVRQSIDSGISESQNGKTIDVKDLRKVWVTIKNECSLDTQCHSSFGGYL